MSHEKNKELIKGVFTFVVIILLVVFVITGCSTTVPVTAKFPDKPQNVEMCPPLETVTDTVKLSELTNSVAKNYSMHYECAVKVDTWNEWYNTQKRIFEGISK
jgi:hypothetical protein